MMAVMTDTTGQAGKLFIWAAWGTEALGVLYDLRWMLALVVVLILADFWWGVSDSLHKRQEFRFSRAGRRTCNKAVDYMTYLLVGSLLGLAVFEPLGWTTHTVTAAVGLGFGCVWEIDSIIGHVCSVHGVTKRFSVKRLLIALIRRKSKAAAEVVEDVLGDDAPKNDAAKREG